MRLIAAVGALALLLPACSAPGPADPSPSPTPSATVLDDGAFTVTPVLDASPTITAEQVRQDLALSYEQNIQKLGPLVLGRVTWGPGLWSTQPSVAPERMAWVQFWQDTTDLMPDDPDLHACSGAGIAPRPSPTPVSTPSRQHALVVDAQTGDAAIYDGAGPSACYAYSAPLAFAATRTDSVPWTSLGGGRVRVALPPCGTTNGGWRSTATTWQELASRGFGACSAAATTLISTANGRLPAEHAPLGPMCARIAAGVPLTRPADCVN